MIKSANWLWPVGRSALRGTSFRGGGALSGYARGTELDAEPDPGIGEAGIVVCQVGVRHMVDKGRHAHRRRRLIAELEASAEQRRRAELLAARRGAVGVPVLDGAAEAAVGEDAVTPPEEALDQGDAPGQSEIARIGVAIGIDRAADMRPRRADGTEE